MVPVFHGVDDGRQPGSTQPRRGDEMSLEMKYIPTAFTRDDAEREARKLYSVQESDWDAFPENIRLSLMLDATILLLSRKLLEAK